MTQKGTRKQLGIGLPVEDYDYLCDQWKKCQRDYDPFGRWCGKTLLRLLREKEKEEAEAEAKAKK